MIHYNLYALQPAAAWLLTPEGMPSVDLANPGLTPFRIVAPGVALIRAEGVFSLTPGMLTYDGYLDAVEAALNVREIGSVVAQLESPGGVAGGLLSATARARGLRRYGKHVITHSAIGLTSAACILSSALGPIHAEPTAVVGSNGLYRAPDKPIPEGAYVGGAQKRQSDPEALNAQIQRLYHTICEDVATSRGISIDRVLAQEAREYYAGPEAIEAGVMDRVCLLHETIEYAASLAAGGK